MYVYSSDECLYICECVCELSACVHTCWTGGICGAWASSCLQARGSPSEASCATCLWMICAGSPLCPLSLLRTVPAWRVPGVGPTRP